MELQKPKIAMYAKRSFGSKLNVSFDFIKENWKLMFKFITYLMLPLCLVQALSLNGFLTGVLSFISTSTDIRSLGFSALSTIALYYVLFVLLILIGIILLSSVVYAMIRTYNEREERLQGVTLKMLKPMLLHNIKRMIFIVLFIMLLSFCLVMVVAFIAPSLLPFIYLIMIPFAIPLSLWSPIYLFENISFMDSFKKTFRLGFATWGGTFLILFIMGLIGNILYGITAIPWGIALIVKMVSVMSDNYEVGTSVGYNFFLYLLAIVQLFGVYLSSVFTVVGLAYQYGHASEVMDNVTVESDIDNFDKL